MVNARNLGTSLFIVFLFLCGIPEPAGAENSKPSQAKTVSGVLTGRTPGAGLEKISVVSVVAYNPGDRSRCPNGFRGAWAGRVKDGDIAVSRDLLKEGVKPGDMACIDFGRSMHCGVVRDTMSERYRKHADLAFDKDNLKKSKKMARAFGKKRGVLYICAKQTRLAE